jgi:Transposase IS66 family
VAPGTLCGALKQVAPLIAPWAEAIAAHGRTAGHVHADETSWQVFEDMGVSEKRCGGVIG